MEGKTCMINGRWLLYMLPKGRQIKNLFIDCLAGDSHCETRKMPENPYWAEENLVFMCRDRSIEPVSVKLVSATMIKSEADRLHPDPEDLEVLLALVKDEDQERSATFYADCMLDMFYSVPNGSVIDICEKDGKIVTKNVICQEDKDHLCLQGQLWHMSSFINIMAANDWHCCPEDLIIGDYASWTIGDGFFLDVMKNGNGYTYKLYDAHKIVTLSGSVGHVGLFLNEARDIVLKEKNMQGYYIKLREQC